MLDDWFLEVAIVGRDRGRRCPAGGDGSTAPGYVLIEANNEGEALTVKPISIPADFQESQLGVYQHLCEDNCEPCFNGGASYPSSQFWALAQRDHKWRTLCQSAPCHIRSGQRPQATSDVAGGRLFARQAAL
ncbi:hypothetical protein [Streptomyces lydicus]|uniref:hypothetical protein n=1 Tax=Streptomyces lydicus TaxID=47763 RepID=UPI0036EAC328